jgi:hypothetical protein
MVLLCEAVPLTKSVTGGWDRSPEGVITLDRGDVRGAVDMRRMWDSKVRLPLSFELSRLRGWYGLREILYIPAPGRWISPSTGLIIAR